MIDALLYILTTGCQWRMLPKCFPPYSTVDVDRQEAAVIMIGVEQGELLVAVNAIQGVVDIEDDALRDLAKSVAVELDHGVHHADERGPAGQVLAATHGRLRAEIGGALGQPADRHLEGRIGAQRITVVGVFIAASDQQYAKADHLGETVADAVGRARIVQAG